MSSFILCFQSIINTFNIDINLRTQIHFNRGTDTFFSISFDPVILRTCCLLWTFILRFCSLGNILCKLSTSFALEHFLRLLTLLWWYHTVNDKLSFQPSSARPWQENSQFTRISLDIQLQDRQDLHAADNHSKISVKIPGLFPVATDRLVELAGSETLWNPQSR